MTRRPALAVAAALSALGLALSIALVHEHANAHAGGTSFCAISEYVNCDRVAMSPYAIVLGLPVAAWGALGYGLELLLALAGLRAGRRRQGWPAGLLALAAAFGVATSVVLAGISTLVIGALCLLCTASWLVSLGLLVAAVRACRPDGVVAAVAGDLAQLRERKRTALGLLVAALALLLVVTTAFPRYWARASADRAGATGPAGPVSLAATSGPVDVIEFSDYACPACARAHEETKALLAGRPGVRVSRRHFPLDSECNPAVKRRMHPGACDLARVGICAEAQGKLAPMEDALFANQTAKRPVDELARAVGLDLEKLKSCLASPETEARLRADVEAGIAVGLRATPTFIVAGKQYPGGIPPEALPPRAAAAAGP